MVGFLRLIGKVSRGEDIAVHKRDGRRTLGGKPVRHIGQVHKSATPAVGGVATVTFTDSSVDATVQTTYTFASQNIGTESADRKVVVVAYVEQNGPTGSPSISSMTINSVAASLVVRQDSATGPGTYVSEMWQAGVPTGTSVTISIVPANDAASCGIGVYDVKGAASAAYASGGSTATPASSVSLSCPAGGIIIAGAGSAVSATWTWTNLTERYDETVRLVGTHTGACDAFASEQTSLSITATASASDTSLHTMVAASWAAA